MGDDDKIISLSIMKELLALQLNAYKDATSLLFESLNKRIDDQNNTIFELRRSLQYSQEDIKDMKKELIECKNQLSGNSVKIGENIQISNSLKIKQAQIEDHSRRKNIRIEGIQESKQETWEQTQFKVQKLIDDKLELENVKVDFAHRIKKKTERNGPRTIIARLAHDTDKEKTMKRSWKLKGSLIYINEDLSEYTIQKRKNKMTDMMKAREAGKIAYFKREKLIVKDRKTTIPHTPEPASASNVASLVQQFTPHTIPPIPTAASAGAESSDHDLESPRRLVSSPVANRLRKKSNSIAK